MTKETTTTQEEVSAAVAAESPATTYPLSQHANDGKSQYGGRDIIGYGSNPPDPRWPNNAKLAINFVVNYEEGSENCLLHGDNESEKLLSEIIGVPAYGKTMLNSLSLD